MIACTFPVEAQKYAIKYLNRYLFNRKKLIVGGHSKGGHLAIISSMYANYFIKRKILKIIYCSTVVLLDVILTLWIVNAFMWA